MPSSRGRSDTQSSDCSVAAHRTPDNGVNAQVLHGIVGRFHLIRWSSFGGPLQLPGLAEDSAAILLTFEWNDMEDARDPNRTQREVAKILGFRVDERRNRPAWNGLPLLAKLIRTQNCLSGFYDSVSSI